MGNKDFKVIQDELKSLNGWDDVSFEEVNNRLHVSIFSYTIKINEDLELDVPNVVCEELEALESILYYIIEEKL